MIETRVDTPPTAATPRIVPVPLLDVPAEIVNAYFNDIARKGLLRLRLCDVKDPEMKDVKELIYRMGKHMYIVWDTLLERASAEFTLENFIGRAAQIHFSVNPENDPNYTLKVCREVTSTVLQDWRSVNHPGQPYLDTLYGLTPVTNRGACAVVLRSGFKKVGILPNGQMKDGTTVVDAMISVKTRIPDLIGVN